MQPDTDASPDPTQDLLEFIYCMPVGAIRFRDDGAIDMLNPMALQSLLPLVRDRAFDNIFTSLEILFPELAQRVAAFQPSTGTIIDHQRVHGRAGAKSVALSLIVSRVRPGVHMMILRDVSRLADMATFAFTAADLLVETDPEGTILWAAGAFEKVLGMSSADTVGKPIAALFAPRDKDGLAAARMALETCGRLPPILLRLANDGQTRCQLSGMVLEGDGGGRRQMLTIGQSPVKKLTADLVVKRDTDFLADVESWSRNGQPGILGVLDVKGWDKAVRGMDGLRRASLIREFGRLAGEAGTGDVIIGDLGGGRFGLLGGQDTDLSGLGASLGGLIGSFSGDPVPVVMEQQIPLHAEDLPLDQALRALRLVLSRVGTSGTLPESDLVNGLAGIIQSAGNYKRDLALAIAERRFDLAYQPIVSLNDGRVHHYEALLRPHTRPGIPAASPQEFVTLAETVGLSVELDLAVLRKALDMVSQCGASIAVNVSGDSITLPSFVDRFIELLAAVTPGLLLVEVTETAEIKDLKAAAVQIDRIRAAGAPVCLDDFGEGGASFRYVRDLRVDYLKIDGSFLQAAARGEQHGLVVMQTMCALARSAGALTVAEMIESEADAALARSLGVDFGQGFYLGAPGAIAPSARPARTEIVTNPLSALLKLK